MRRPLVEILYFEGCPNHEAARELVDRVSEELRVRPTIDLVEVADAEAAARLRFLGSPTIRVEGRDIEPGSEARFDFALSCRVYGTAGGVSMQPDEAWIRDALSEALA